MRGSRRGGTGLPVWHDWWSETISTWHPLRAGPFEARLDAHSGALSRCEALDDCLTVLQRWVKPNTVPVQVHCILGSQGDVDRYAGEGHRKATHSLSLDQLLLESDAPYLSCPTEILKLSFILHVFSPYQGQHYHVLVYTLQVPGQNYV